MSKVEKFMNLVEYIVTAFSNWDLTRHFREKGRLKIFFVLTIRAFFCILIITLIEKKIIEPIADAVFDVGKFPVFFQPLCLFIVKKNLNFGEYLS